MTYNPIKGKKILKFLKKKVYDYIYLIFKNC
jgi:hypothetical protein